MTRDLLIALHAAGCGTAFVSGLGAFAAPRRRFLLSAYIWSLSAGVLAVALVVAIDWRGLDTGSQAAFAALLALGAYMVRRASRAVRLLGRSRPEQALADIGFTLIALLDGFAIILALGLGLATPAVIALAIAVVVAGRRGLAWLGRLPGSRFEPLPGGETSHLRSVSARRPRTPAPPPAAIDEQPAAARSGACGPRSRA